MSKIKILDCTLRDGGYINDWAFGQDKSKAVITLLQNAKVDYIETGFLTTEISRQNQTLFNSFDKITTFMPKDYDKTRLVGMITYGKFPIELVPNVNVSCVDGLRVIFKKTQKDEALDYCRKIKEKGYKLFINPTFTDQYSDEELLELLTQIREINPYGVSIVDSMGVMKEKDLRRLYYLIDNNLDEDIALCFHSHNNLQLSFSNAQCLMKICNNRELIIDSTVFGMGRGAGNLCTELITQYINDNYGGNYDIVPILKIVDEQINPIFAKTPWGYSVPYYLAATNHCHPNYAKYLVDKQTVPVEVINKLLQAIPNHKKSSYDADMIKQIYLDNFSKSVDDSLATDELKKGLSGKSVLMLAPGKSLSTEQSKVKQFIADKKPFVVSLNFIPADYEADVAFVSNMKRFSSLDDFGGRLFVTSNIEEIPETARVLNYTTYLNDSKMYDNAALMFLKLLSLIGIKEVNVAGLDGFSNIPTENYVSNELINNAKLDEFDERNIIMSKELKKFSKEIRLNFITKTHYFENIY